MASLQSSPKSITSLKIHVDNDLHNKESKLGENNNCTSDTDEEMEEGEASEDEIEVNVIVSKPVSIGGSLVLCDEKQLGKSKKQESWNSNSVPLNSMRRMKDEYEDFIEFQTQSNEDLLEERASRFGIPASKFYVPRSDILKLYKSLEIDEDDFSRGGWRPDTVHMRGIEGMHTEDIFEYFRKYSPRNIEWLNSNSCNVVWLEKNGAARALLGLSCPIRPSVKKSKNYSDDKRRKSLQVSERSNVKIQKPPVTLKSRIDKVKVKTKSSSDKSNSSSSEDSSSSSDSEEDEEGKENSTGSSSSDSSSSSNSSGDDSSSSSSSSESDSSSDSSSDSEEESTKMDTEESSKVKKLTRLPSPLPRPPPKDSIRVTVENTNGGGPAEDGSVSMDDIGVAVPSGRWRLGVPCPFTKAIFLRFAHSKDKKVLGLKKPVELNKKYSASKSSPKYRSPPRRRHRRRSNELYKPDIHDKNHRVPPLDQPRRSIPDFPIPVEKEDAGISYQDLDDPFEDVRNPWGYLAQNWGQRETQDSLDYHAMLRDHVTGKKRKPDFSDCEGDDRHKRLRGASRAHIREMDFSGVSPPQDYIADDVRMSDGSDDHISWKSKIKLPRMRMYADAEEKKVKRKPSGAVLRRIGSKSRIPSIYPRSESLSTNRNFDLRAKLQSKKRKEKKILRASYSESE